MDRGVGGTLGCARDRRAVHLEMVKSVMFLCDMAFVFINILNNRNSITCSRNLDEVNCRPWRYVLSQCFIPLKECSSPEGEKSSCPAGRSVELQAGGSRPCLAAHWQRPFSGHAAHLPEALGGLGAGPWEWEPRFLGCWAEAPQPTLGSTQGSVKLFPAPNENSVCDSKFKLLLSLEDSSACSQD